METVNQSRYYQDIREIIACSTVEEANGKLKDPSVELLKVEHRTRLSKDGKEISSEPLFILGRRAFLAEGKPDATNALKYEFEQHIPKDAPAFLSFKGRILDKLEKDKGVKYKIVEDDSHNVRAVECFGKMSEDDKKAIERYVAWLKKVALPPPE